MKLSVPVVYDNGVFAQNVVIGVSAAGEPEPASHIIKFTDDHSVAVKKKVND